jgi:hypothetical protein
MAAFFCTDVQATPVESLPWSVMRWSVEVTFEETRAHLGGETQRQWSDKAIARTTPVLLALDALVTLLALRLSQGGLMPVAATARYQKPEPPLWIVWPWCVVISGAPAMGCTLLRTQSASNFPEKPSNACSRAFR